MKTAYLTWIYNDCEVFLSEYIETMNNQSCKDVDLFYIQNGLNNTKTNYLMENLSFKNVNLLKYDKELSIYSKIQKSIQTIASLDYDMLIFGDVDDKFSNNRFEEYINQYDDSYGIYYNDLKTFDGLYDFFKGKLPSRINDFTEISHGNCLGMSHTGININKIKTIISKLYVPDDVIAFDWYFYTIILYNKIKAKVIRNVSTYYRIYSNNLAGDINEINEGKLFKSCNVKLNHYGCLMNEINEFVQLHKETYRICNYIKSSKEHYLKYTKYIQSKSYIYWWENIDYKFLEENYGVK